MTENSDILPTAWPVWAHPSIRQAGRFPHNDRGFTRRYRGTPTLHCYEYSGRVRLDGREFALAPGDVTVTACGQQASYDLPRPGYHLCIHFTPGAGVSPSPGPSGPASCGKGTFRLPMHVPAEHARVEGVAFSEAMLQVIRLHAIGEVDELGQAASSAGLQRLLLALGLYQHQHRLAVGRGGRGDVMEEAAMLLRRSMDEPLDVPGLARSMGLSQNYLARLFKQRFGVTMQRYHLRCRMEYAALLLQTTNLSIGQVAARVGMPDPQHFNKQFRAFHGNSPSAMR